MVLSCIRKQAEQTNNQQESPKSSPEAIGHMVILGSAVASLYFYVLCVFVYVRVCVFEQYTCVGVMSICMCVHVDPRGLC